MEKEVLMTTNYNTHKFEVVEELPYGYHIWNIGRHNFPFECYIPLCQSDENFNVNVDTLKALKVKDEEFALELMRKTIREGLKYEGLKQLLKNQYKEVA